MTDWKPVSPCIDCSQRDSYCPPRNRFGCEDFKIYQGGIDAQRKLLEYMDEPCDKHGTLIVDIGYPLSGVYFKGEQWYYNCRSDCPQCLNELKEANK